MKEDSFFELWDKFLYDYNLYYRNLSDKGRVRFVKRVESIYDNTKIVGREGLEINEPIKILVVANLVQLTFGLKHFWLYGYEYIYIYPDAFFIESTGQTVKGSTYNDKIISLSWRDFALDHLRQKDGQNISFAQYALALVRTVYNGKNYDLSFGSYLDVWFDIINKESIVKIDPTGQPEKEPDSEELPSTFARCAELFFEKPELFRKELPTSYAHFCLLLNQDPLNITDDYKYDRNRLNKANLKEMLPEFISKNYKYKTWHWSFNLCFFGFAACPMIIYLLRDSLLVSVNQIAMTILAFGLVISIVFFPHLKKIGLYKNWILLLLNSLIGIAPCLITGYLLINSFYGYEFTTKVTRHKIASYYQDVEGKNQFGNPTTFNFSDDYLIDNPRARTFEQFEQRPLHIPTLFNGVEYETRNGLLGLPILINRKLY